MKTQIPAALIFLRLLIGFTIICLCIARVDNYKTATIILLSIGLLTDIFDGIIARRLNVSTQRLRRLDSTIDQIFFISVAVAAYIQCPGFFKANAFKLILLFGIEGLTYL